MRNDNRQANTTSLFIMIIGVTFTGSGCTFGKHINGTFDIPEDEEMQYIKLDDAQPSGYFDIGAGFGVIQKSGNDVKGTIVSFKGYPYGRWYAKAKTVDQFTLANQVTDAVDSCGEDTEENQDCETNKQELRQQINNLYQESSKNRIIRSMRGWKHRLSIFYGVSASDFDGDGLSTSVDALGFGIDITPELSIIAGFANYENDDGGISNDYIYGVSLNLNAFDILNSR